MRRLLLIAAMLLPLSSGAQIIGDGSVLSQGVIFNASFVGLTSGCITSPVDSANHALTFTRASTAFMESASTTCNNNQLRVSSTNGIYIERSASNLVQQSEDFSTTWSATTATVSTNTSVAPDGNTTADTLTSTGAGGFFQSNTWTASALKYVVSIYVKTSVSNQSFDIVIRDTTAGTNYASCTNTSTGAFVRYYCAGSGNATNGDALALRVYPGGAGGTGAVVAWGAQGEIAASSTAAQPSTYVKTTTGTGTRQGDTLSLGNFNMPPNSFSMSVDFVPDWAVQSTFNDTMVMQMYVSAAERLQLYIDVSNSTVNCSYNGGGSSYITGNATNKITANTSNHLSCSYDGTNLKVCVNGSCLSYAKTFSLLAQSYTLDIGNYGVASNNVFGYLANICVGKLPGSCY